MLARRLSLLLFAIVACVFFSNNARADEVVVFDNTYAHGGGNRWFSDWDFAAGMSFEPGVPRNWLSPVDYYHGTYRVRVEVLSMGPITPGGQAHLQFGWWNIPGDPEIRHLASQAYVYFGAPGVYEETGTVSGIPAYYGAGEHADEQCYDWDWTSAYADNTFYTLVNPHGMPVGQDGFPYELRVTVTVSSDGEPDAGPDAQDSAPDADNPRPDADNPRPDADNPRPDADNPRPDAAQPQLDGSTPPDAGQAGSSAAPPDGSLEADTGSDDQLESGAGEEGGCSVAARDGHFLWMALLALLLAAARARKA